MSQNNQSICPQCDQPVTEHDWHNENVNLEFVAAGITVHKRCPQPIAINKRSPNDNPNHLHQQQGSHFIFQPSVVIEGTKYEVTCIAQWHELIFCGCSDYSLRVFTPHISAQGSATQSYKCLFKDSKFGKNISQLEIVEYYNLLIAIIDETAHFYKIIGNYPEYTQETDTAVDKCKLTINVKHLFSVEGDEDHGSSTSVLTSCSKAWSKGEQRTLLIGIGCQQKSIARYFNSFYLQLFHWTTKNLKATDIDFDNPTWSDVLKKINVYPLPEKPYCMVFAAKNLIIGCKNEYHLLQLEDASKRKIFQTGKSKKAAGIRTPTKEVLLVVDRQGFFVDYDGKSSRSDCIEWSDVPSKLLYAFPYVVAVLAKTIEVHDSYTMARVASYDFTGGISGTFSCYQCNDKVWRNYVSVSASNTILALNMGSMRQQLTDLKGNKHFSEAANLCEMVEKEQFEIENLDRTIEMIYINEFLAYNLFNKYIFEESKIKFEQSGVSVRRIISLFSSLVPPGQCRNAMRHPVDVRSVDKTQKLLKEAITQFLRPYLVAIRKEIEDDVENGATLDAAVQH